MPATEPKLPTRYDVEWAVERSGLPTIAKDALFCLARRMQQGSTLVMPQHSPSLNSMAAATGWSKRHIQRALAYLEALCLITRHRPSAYDARVRHIRTAYTVHYDALLKLGTGSPTGARDSWSYGVGTPRRKARDKPSDELGTGSREARDTLALSQNLSVPTDQSDPEIAFIRGHLRDRTGQVVSEDQAAEIRAVILARPGAQGQRAMAYIRRVLTLDKHPEKWLQPQPPESQEET